MNKIYLQNIKPINTLKNSPNHNLSDMSNYTLDKDSMNNMIINSNLDNEDLIR